MNYLQEAQMSVIGAVVLDDRAVLAKIGGMLQPVHFLDPQLALVYEVLLAMAYEGERVDFVTLHHRLLQKGFEDSTAKTLIVSCMELCPTIHHAQAHATIVLDSYRARKANGIAQEILNQTLSHENAKEVITGAGEQLAALLLDDRAGKLTAMGDIIGQDYMSLFDKERLSHKLEIGLSKVNWILDGIYRPDLVIIGARPAVGKTAFVMQFIKSAATKGKKVAFYSLEMSRQQLMQRYLSNVSGVPLGKIKNIDCSNEEVTQVAQACDTLFHLPLSINDRAYTSVADIKNECRFIKGLDLIVIDYLQLLQPRAGQRYGNRTEQVGQISRDLKILAKELNLPVVVLSQLNRVNDEGQEPSIADLRESGSIEQDADTILLLWKHDEEENIIGCKVCKNRNGPTGKTALVFDGEHMKFASSGVLLDTPKKKAAYPWEK